MLKSILYTLITFFTFTLHASHVAGGNISYKATNNPNEVEFTLTFYRDCSGVSSQNSYALTIHNGCTGLDSFVIVNNFMEEDISQFCPAAASISPCNGGNIGSGFIKTVFKGTHQFNSFCDDWVFSLGICNRNPSANLLGNPCFYIETTMDNLNFPNNSSPFVTDIFHIPTYTLGSTAHLSNYIVDQDQDSLRFSLVAALEFSGDSVDYVSPYSGTSPITNISIDPATGQLSFPYSMSGNYTIAVLVEEFSELGQLKGTFINDYIISLDDQMVNAPPSFGNISNFNNFGTNASFGNNELTLGVGDQFCFDVQMTDTDANDSISITSDIQTVLPNSTITYSGSNPTTATVCWNFQPNYMSNAFSIKATDNACPYLGSNSQTYLLNMPPATSNIIGSNLSYSTTNNPNEIAFTLNILADCNAFYFESDMQINIQNNCGFSDTSIVLFIDSEAEISPLCPAEINNSSCNGGTLPFGYKKFTYKGIHQLAGNCSDWNFNFTYSNRGVANNLQSSDAVYVESTLNNSLPSTNSSPYLSDLFEIPFLINGQTMNLSNFIIDPDQDSLKFSLVSALNSQGAAVTYSNGYSGTNPMPGISMDESTGQLTISNAVEGKYSITVLVEEFSNQGDLKGTFMHDFILQVVSNSNSAPSISPIVNFNNYETFASFNDYNIQLVNGEQFCFDLTFTDVNSADNINVETDILEALPNATITASGNNPYTATICWAFEPGLKNVFFSIKAKDNACPIVGANSQTIHISPGDFVPSNLALAESIANSTKIYKVADKIHIESSLTYGTVQVYDMTGKLLINKKINGQQAQINLTFPTQIFIVKLFDANGSLIKTQKL
ncbi:hypothetical protein DNU06_08365 [Putridiphycobacter roseus]|uniref:Secretion system C-terminal sorting domain-containing protein n=1 Tax=Putridiphycobacter roseus TaxID=2219161 RepID=A0A2W1MZD6_9FLAO|nr:T9SS type A sorting domain-containing protein [Putridiphycobacter roseus]PZE17277.1 hypothetical protein DNU06_08365 [Putridiphycobacter roseus]